MSSDINKTRVGAFVVGGFLLLIVGLISLGGRQFFSDDINYVLYFDGSVSGLAIGAPVVFRGVPLGSVTKISLVANARDEGVTIPVFIRINANSIVRIGKDSALTDSMREEIIRRMVQRGLRARLQLQSLITGQYRVELDFFPDTPARYHSSDRSIEIPTVPSPLDEIQRTLARLPLESMATAFNDALQSIANLASNQDIPAALAAFRGTFENAEKLLSELRPMREELRRMLVTMQGTANTLNTQLPEAVAAFQLAMNSFAAAAGQIERTVKATEGLVGRDSRTMREVNMAIKEFTDTARAVRALAVMLERRPEALLLGKGGKQ